MNTVATLAVLGIVVLLSIEYGALRAVVGAGAFILIVAFGARHLKRIGTMPPEPEIEEVAEYGLKYVCTNCGLELRVERAAGDKAPRHCMEPMELVREGGEPPLRPV